MWWLFAYVVISLPLGWLFFQHPKESVHFDRLGIFDLWLWGLTWPVVLILIFLGGMCELLKDR